METKQRMLALDVMRGFTIAGMCLVNNGGGPDTFAPLRHAQWNGFTPTDCVFPFFMFIMGVSMYISLQKAEFQPSGQLIGKILWRSAKIFLTGSLLYVFGILLRHACHDTLAEGFAALADIRILGVLHRLAICYGIGSLMAIFINHKFLPYIAVGLLVGYEVILLLGNGFEYGEGNILSKVDQAVLGLNHMYKDNFIEPEGLLSTIPSIAHTLIGFCMGRLCVTLTNMKERLNQMYFWGAILLIVGFLFTFGCPINKKVWSPTFVLVTTGAATLLLCILLEYLDVRKHGKWTWIFVVFGMNSIFCYAWSSILSTVFGTVTIADVTLKGWIYHHGIEVVMGQNEWASLAWALFIDLLVWIVAYVLYKKKIYIKL